MRDTVVMGTAMVSNKTVKGLDYFPLSIDYEEKFYASGKISGSRFIKREGRPSDDAILFQTTDGNMTVALESMVKRLKAEANIVIYAK